MAKMDPEVPFLFSDKAGTVAHKYVECVQKKAKKIIKAI